MNLTTKHLKIILVLVVLCFGVGIYLQDKEHQKSTQHAWKANRYNLERFDKITKLNASSSSLNWKNVKESIALELDTLMILRFRKEVDSLGVAPSGLKETAHDLRIPSSKVSEK